MNGFDVRAAPHDPTTQPRPDREPSHVHVPRPSRVQREVPLVFLEDAGGEEAVSEDELAA